ncbi:hypothetical protein HK101_004919, partial [Irineochytrium annulatum]
MQIHTDDGAICYDPEMEAEVDAMLQKIRARFEIKAMGELRQYLGIWLSMSVDSTKLDQEVYCQSILDEFQEEGREE